MTPTKTIELYRQVENDSYARKCQTRFANNSRSDTGSEPASDGKTPGYDSSFLADRGHLTRAD